ncbi:MAG: type IV pilus modification protein PilV [Candidatus Methylumidiphilus sp.]
MNSPRKAAAGFTLIEVLVALFILAFGLLGMAGLQMKALKYNHDAYLRSQATLLANDIIDRMRVNQAGVTGGNYNNQAVSDSPPNCFGSTANCTSIEMAAYDLAAWNAAIAAQLPDGEGAVCIDSTPTPPTPPIPPDCDGTGTVYAITISWSEREANTDAVVKSFVTSFEP